MRATIPVFLLACGLVSGCGQGDPTGLQPADSTVATPTPAADLKAAVTDRLRAWRGKEVVVIGDYASDSPTTNGHTKEFISVQVNLRDSDGKFAVGCVSSTPMPADYTTQRQGRVVRGTVREINSLGLVMLEPCGFVR